MLGGRNQGCTNQDNHAVTEESQFIYLFPDGFSTYFNLSIERVRKTTENNACSGSGVEMDSKRSWARGVTPEDPWAVAPNLHPPKAASSADSQAVQSPKLLEHRPREPQNSRQLSPNDGSAVDRNRSEWLERRCLWALRTDTKTTSITSGIHRRHGSRSAFGLLFRRRARVTTRRRKRTDGEEGPKLGKTALAFGWAGVKKPGRQMA